MIFKIILYEYQSGSEEKTIMQAEKFKFIAYV
jgi:hypothetical protein